MPIKEIQYSSLYLLHHPDYTASCIALEVMHFK